MPRNFPGRSGTSEDSVYLCSPETAAASALTGYITDARTLGLQYPALANPAGVKSDQTLVAPLDAFEAAAVVIERTDNIAPLPVVTPVVEHQAMPILLKLGDDVSTDEILPAGNDVMPLWTNFPRVSRYVFRDLARDYASAAQTAQEAGQHHIILAGNNYGQGSSRENAALVPAALGLCTVIAKSFARIHWQNLINFGVLPLTLRDPAHYVLLKAGHTLGFDRLIGRLRCGFELEAVIAETGSTVTLRHALSARQIDLIEAGGAINLFRAAGGAPAGPTTNERQ